MSKLRILIVEDEAVTAADLHDELNAQGYEVTGTVDTAEAALISAMANKPDLVLMDINLSGANDGVFAARALRAKEIPVIFLTAHYDDRTLGTAKLTAPVGYITKPFNSHQLGVAIEIGIARHRSDIKRMRVAQEQEYERAQGNVPRMLAPFCVQCKKICDENGEWQSAEAYLSKHSDLTVTDSLCLSCARGMYEELSHPVVPAPTAAS
jgi:DNA-binding response OmpR family regulator